MPTPIINQTAKEILEAINEIFCQGFAGEGAVQLGEFLDSVLVFPTPEDKDPKDEPL